MRTGIALGSNVGDRLAHLRAARDHVVALHGIGGPILLSSIYTTEPVDCPPGTSAFLNAVIELEFVGEVRALIQALLNIETDMGRDLVRVRNSPRTIDLDILYCGDLILNEPDLVVPHPRIAERAFVLAPLRDIRPDLVLPGQSQSVEDLLADLDPDSTGKPRIDGSWESPRILN